MQLLLCYNNEGVYVSTYGKATKSVFLQWGETPSSVGKLILKVTFFVYSEVLTNFRGCMLKFITQTAALKF